MSRQKNSILTNEHVLKREPVPLGISSENKGKQTKGKKIIKKLKRKKVYNVWDVGFSGIITRSPEDSLPPNRF